MDIDSRLAELGILRIDTIVDAVPRSRGARSNPPANREVSSRRTNWAFAEELHTLGGLLLL